MEPIARSWSHSRPSDTGQTENTGHDASSEPSLCSSWFERAVPKPVQDVGCQLLHDSYLKETLQHPQEGPRLYAEEVERRKGLEPGDGDYCFAPLLTSLHNMQRLTEHILSDRHFSQPLSAADRAAFAVLADDIEQLIVEKAPYKRTVQLALQMSCMQEIATARHVIKELRSRLDASSDVLLYKHTRLFTVDFEICCEDGKTQELTTDEIPLAMALPCNGEGFSLKGTEGTWQLVASRSYGLLLSRWLDDNDVFLYPSFEPLDPADFCRLAHLPVYPLGMMTAHALNADGCMMTPLRFFYHDIGHVNTGCGWRREEAGLPLCSMDNRLQFRQLVLDKLPDALAGYRLERALEMLLFNLFHEYPIRDASQALEAGHFLPLLLVLVRASREERLHYPAAWQAIDERQAALACLWVHRLYKALRDGEDDRTDWVESLCARFVTEDIPALHRHLTFVHRHRDSLRAHFESRSEMHKTDDGDRWVVYSSQSPWSSCYMNGELTLLHSSKSHPEESMDNTDLVYFDVLHDLKSFWRMVEATGKTPPPERF